MTNPRWLRRLQVLLAPLALFGATGAHAEPIGESLGDGIARFWADAAARDGALPSLALAAPRAATGELPASFAVQRSRRIDRTFHSFAQGRSSEF